MTTIADIMTRSISTVQRDETLQAAASGCRKCLRSRSSPTS